MKRMTDTLMATVSPTPCITRAELPNLHLCQEVVQKSAQCQSWPSALVRITWNTEVCLNVLQYHTIIYILRHNCACLPHLTSSFNNAPTSNVHTYNGWCSIMYLSKRKTCLARHHGVFVNLIIENLVVVVVV